MQPSVATTKRSRDTIITGRRNRRGEPRPLFVAGTDEASRWVVAAGAGYWRWAFRGGPARRVYEGMLSGMVSFNHQGSHFFDITNSPQSREGSYTLVDARIGYEADSGNWELAAFAKNLFDKEYRVYTFDFGGIGGFNQQFFGRPQWFGVQLTLRH